MFLKMDSLKCVDIFTDRRPPEEYISSTDKVHLEFQSDGTEQHHGFSADVKMRGIDIGIVIFQ